MPKSFDDAVRKMKAAKWLVANDPFIRKAADFSARSLEMFVLIAAEHGESIKRKLAGAAREMEVTRQDREVTPSMWSYIYETGDRPCFHINRVTNALGDGKRFCKDCGEEL